MWLSTVLGPTDKVGKQGSKLETLVCHFSRLGWHKMSQIKIQTFLAKVDQDAKRWDLLESDENKEEGAMVIENGIIW